MIYSCAVEILCHVNFHICPAFKKQKKCQNGLDPMYTHLQCSCMVHARGLNPKSSVEDHIAPPTYPVCTLSHLKTRALRCCRAPLFSFSSLQEQGKRSRRAQIRSQNQKERRFVYRFPSISVWDRVLRFSLLEKRLYLCPFPFPFPLRAFALLLGFLCYRSFHSLDVVVRTILEIRIRVWPLIWGSCGLG